MFFESLYSPTLKNLPELIFPLLHLAAEFFLVGSEISSVEIGSLHSALSLAWLPLVVHRFERH